MAKNKGRKFFAASATAALVASAIVPVASAAYGDEAKIASWAKESVDYVTEAGFMQGNDGNFNPTGTFTRAEAATIATKVLGLDTSKTEYDKSFTDVKEGQWFFEEVSAAAEAGIVNGTGDGKFNPNGKLSRQDAAIILAKIYDLDVDAADVSVLDQFSDKGSIAGYATKHLAALVEADIIKGANGKINPTGDITRQELAVMLAKSDVTFGEAPIEEVTIDSVSAINAKTIEVKFNTAVEDTTKAKVELLRGSFKQNVTLTWSEDKTSVQLAGASNFQAADYTVNVSGLSEEVLTANVKIEAQKVTSIEILDEVAVVDTAANSTGVFAAGTKATVSYVVKDQYGTDITKTTSLTTNDSSNTTIKAVQASGVVELSGAVVEGKKAGDIVPVVLVDTATGVSVSKTVKLSTVATVSSIAVAGIYNAKGEEVSLNDKSKATDAFIVLDLKDQYGKEITDPLKATGLVITNTNPTNLTIQNTVSSQKIGDKNKLVIKITDILKPGNTDILLISTTNGQSAKYTVQVSETSTTDGISVSQPEIAVANEPTLIPLTVTDKQGNLVTDKKLLADANKGIKVGGITVAESALEVKDGQVYYKTTFGSAGTQALVFQSASFKVATVTINVKAEAVATVVRGFKNPLVLSTHKAPVAITAVDHLVIEDQYGREMKGSTAPVTVSLVGTSDVVDVAGNTVTAKKNGTATLKIVLDTQNGTIDSAVEVQVQVTDGTEYTGYEIQEIGKIEGGVAKAFTVNGILNNGKVALEASEYTATISGGKITTSDLTTIFANPGELIIADTLLNTDTNTPANPVDTEFTLKVTINATGQVLEQKFVVSPDAPKTQEFFFTAAAAASDYKDAKAITEATLVSGGTVANLKSTGETPAAVTIATVDQYGNKEVKAIAADTVTIVPDKVADVTITGNGTAGAIVTLKSGVETATVTLKVKVGNATQEIKVKVVEDPTPAPTTVTVESGSVAGATADDKKITGLTDGNKYVVTVGTKFYGVLANGTLSAEQSTKPDAQALAVALSGTTEITGLTNGTTYKVEEVTP
ncbi:S-layer homology domain-containing protein [Lysinibacillus sp. 54212]|uniref:S-layer homology domain-containing protein n=1 Tax=Lysinibacillus sp. 54212 TaxID=3119829 RepID=UPI002FCCAE7A